MFMPDQRDAGRKEEKCPWRGRVANHSFFRSYRQEGERTNDEGEGEDCQRSCRKGGTSSGKKKKKEELRKKSQYIDGSKKGISRKKMEEGRRRTFSFRGGGVKNSWGGGGSLWAA